MTKEFCGSKLSNGLYCYEPATINYPHEYNLEEAHKQAALTLQTKMNWKGK